MRTLTPQKRSPRNATTEREREKENGRSEKDQRELKQEEKNPKLRKRSFLVGFSTKDKGKMWVQNKEKR